MQFRKTSFLSAGCETIFAVSDAFLSQHTSKLFLYPVFHRCFGSRLPDGFSSSFHIQLYFSIAGISHHLIRVFEQAIQASTVLIAQFIDTHLPSPILTFQRAVCILFFQCIRCFVGQLIHQVKVSSLEDFLEFVRPGIFDDFFQ